VNTDIADLASCPAGSASTLRHSMARVDRPDTATVGPRP
jgi:hypothetical protein